MKNIILVLSLLLFTTNVFATSTIQSGSKVNQKNVTGTTYTVLPTDDTITVSATSNGVSITLPVVSSTNLGKRYTFIRTDSALANNITINTSASQIFFVSGAGSTMLFGTGDTITIEASNLGSLGWTWVTGPYRTTSFNNSAGQGSCLVASDTYGVMSSASGTPSECTIVLKTGVFSSAPVCSCTPQQSFTVTGNGGVACNVSGGPTSFVTHQFINGTTTYNGVGGAILCTGLR